MMRCRIVLLAAALLITPGCKTPLDTAWHDVNTTFRQGNKAFAAVTRVYAKCADEMAGKKHDLQALHLQRDWADFVKIHTNKDGRLVSLNEQGVEMPLRVEDLQSAVAARDAKLAAINASKASWAALHEPYAEAIGKFEAITDSTGETEEKILAAKASAQQFLDSALTAIGGIAAGVFTGAAVVP